jgi:hypothetical protein
MPHRLATLGLIVISLQSCRAGPDTAVVSETMPRGPLESLPAGTDLQLVRSDLIATASGRFGAQALNEALGAQTYLIAKRFVGMPPPPPPGAGADWAPPTPTALLLKRDGAWMVATPSGWRAAKPEVAAELEKVIAAPSFWSEPAYTPPCPDYGASLLLVKTRNRAETVRNSTCSSDADKVVLAALRA